MIYMILSESWARYHTFSPYYNFIHDKEMLTSEGHYRIFVPNSPDYTAIQHQINEEKPTAIVCDPITYTHFLSFSGIKLMLLNDIHCFTLEDTSKYDGANSLQKALDWSTASLTGYMFSTKKPDRYFYPKDTSKYVYFPHHVSCSPAVFNEFTSRKDEMLVVGSVHELVYPLRTYARTLPFSHRPAEHISRDQFLPELANYKRAFTCNSWLGYTVAKYFEIPKAGTVLIGVDMTTKCERELLGFKSGENCFLINEAADLLELPEATPEIAECGRQLILNRHTTKNRVRQIGIVVDMLDSGHSVQDCVTVAYTNSY